MSISTASGPWRSLTGFITPVTYVSAADVVGGVYQIKDAGANIVILSEAAGGPTGAVVFRLPVVTTNTPNNATFNVQNARPEFNGVSGSILNYAADRAYSLLGGVDANGNTQYVNGSATGVAIATGAVVQWGGNGNPDLPWVAISNNLAATL